MADLALGVVGATAAALHWGVKILDLCKSIKNAPGEIFDRVVRVEAIWARMFFQLNQGQRLADSMTDEQRRSYERATQLALQKLQAVYTALLAISDKIRLDRKEPGPLRNRSRFRYGWRKQELDEAIAELEACQRVQDTAPLLLYKIAAKILDGPGHAPRDDSATVVSTQTNSSALERFLPADNLRNAKSTPVAMSGFTVATILNKNYLVDAFSFPPVHRGMTCAVSRDVRSLATKLAAVHEQHLIGMLSCKGVVKDKTDREQRFSFLFRLPPGFTAPQSLRHALASTSPPALSDILRIGQDLAAAISLVHAFGFVHKNVRPETVVLRCYAASGQSSATLAGFEKFRLDGGCTGRVGDESWGHNVYRHPSRHGRCPAEAFVMQHDIYSLGVCLLEIGLWKSFVHVEESQQQQQQSAKTQPSAWYRQHAKRPDCRDPSALKDDLMALAEEMLPQRMGCLYTKLVKTCLTCLDADNEDFGDESEFLDDDGILVGVRYVEKVLYQLQRIRM